MKNFTLLNEKCQPINIVLSIFIGCLCLSIPSITFAQSLKDTEGPVYTQLSNIPTLYIETQNHADITSKENYVRATINLIDGNKITTYDQLGIRGRGNSTWNLDKKPYRIKFDSKEKFLGNDHAKAKSWTLLANHSDKSLMRNAIASFIGTFAGQPFTAATQFVDLVLNDKYLGTYQISDQMEVRDKRVEITEQEEGLTANDNISGGYFLEVDGFATSEPVYFKTNKGITITIKSPDEEIISKDQINYIRNYINKFETALFSQNFTDAEQGYRQYVDESTLASWYIASELTANVDCFWSTYIYKDKDDPKIYWGPLWDYDIAFNNCVRAGDVTNALMTSRGFGSDLTKIWIVKMWNDPWFANLINNKWKEVVDAGIEEAILDYIDELADLLEESQELNFHIWPINKRVYDELRLFSTYREGVEYLKNFISAHIAYLTPTFEQAARSLTPPEPFDPAIDYFYTITNRGVSRRADVGTGNGICIWEPSADRLSQHWRFVANGEGYYQIINRDTELAVTDAATSSGNGYNTGAQLSQATPDITDPRQLWSITPASHENEMGYIIANAETNLAWNNSGGGTANGNSIITWLNDEDNPSKPLRQWYINRTNDKTTSLERFPNNGPEYYITYSRNDGMLHFRVEGGAELNGTASIISLDGKVLMQFKPSPDIDITSLPAGYYILSWVTAGKQRSLKFAR